MDVDEEFEANFIKKCTELPTEEMGIYLIRCLKQAVGERNGRHPVSTQIKTYDDLLEEFRQRVNAIDRTVPAGEAEFEKLADVWKSLQKKFDEACGVREYVPIRMERPPKRVAIYSRGRSYRNPDKCSHGACVLVTAWRYETSQGTIWLCSDCDKQLQSQLGPKPVDMWSKMVFSAFETNRRKH